MPNTARVSSSIKKVRRTLAFALFLPVCAALTMDPGPQAPTPTGKQLYSSISENGVLRVITRRGYTTWFEGGQEFSGFENDLVNRFAERLGLELDLVIADTPGELISHLKNGEFHLAAAGLGQNVLDRAKLYSSEPFVQRRYNIVYRKGAKPIDSPAALIGKRILVPSGSNAVPLLQNITESYPLVRWDIVNDRDEESLLRSVAGGQLDATIVDEHTLTVMKQHSPALVAGYTFAEPIDVAWAFHQNSSHVLRYEANNFLADMRRHGQIGRLEERYFEPARHQNYFDLKVFRQRIADTLPRYRHIFIKAGHKYDVDWRLVAALSYQESMWNPAAESSTGVRGIMQLTKATAKRFKADRENIHQAIDAGAQYLSLLARRVPDSVDGTDRLWMALASYNVGPGHVDDARDLTRMFSGDPDSWRDVKRHLLMLKNPEYYSQTKYGRARGGEAVHLVTRVRSFYDVLVQYETNDIEYNAEPIAPTPEHRTVTYL